VEWLNGVCFERFGNPDGPRALARVWKAQHFSYWMTTMLHMLPATSTSGGSSGELELVTGSVAGSTYLIEAYTGWPSR
jgi:p-hydroxybenzoate 3-monooxygenase